MPNCDESSTRTCSARHSSLPGATSFALPPGLQRCGIRPLPHANDSASTDESPTCPRLATTLNHDESSTLACSTHWQPLSAAPLRHRLFSPSSPTRRAPECARLTASLRPANAAAHSARRRDDRPRSCNRDELRTRTCSARRTHLSVSTTTLALPLRRDEHWCMLVSSCPTSPACTAAAALATPRTTATSRARGCARLVAHLSLPSLPPANTAAYTPRHAHRCSCARPRPATTSSQARDRARHAGSSARSPHTLVQR